MSPFLLKIWACENALFLLICEFISFWNALGKESYLRLKTWSGVKMVKLCGVEYGSGVKMTEISKFFEWILAASSTAYTL